MAQILRVSLVGGMPSGEEWSVNPCWEINGSGGAPVSPSQASALAAAIGAVTPPATLTELWNNVTTYTGCRVEARSLTGALEAQADFRRPVAVPGTGTSPHPYQTSVVVSLRTPGVGPSARGRLYWPATGVPLTSTTLRLSISVRDSVLNGVKSYLTSIETAIKATLPNANLTVWSRKTENFHDVNQLQLGDVVDVQRRRRDTLLESYGSVAFPQLPMYPSLGDSEGFTTAVMDSPVYDRLLVRYLRRWTGLMPDEGFLIEWDDGNGMWIRAGVSLD